MNGIIPLLTYIFVVTFTPGPNNIMSMTKRHALRLPRHPCASSPVFCAGSPLSLSARACSTLFMANLIPASGKWLKILAAVYMFYLAFRILRSGPIDDGKEGYSTNRFWFGFSMQFMNVKAILFTISVFSLFVSDFSKDFFMVVLLALFLVFVTFYGDQPVGIGRDVVPQSGAEALQSLQRHHGRAADLHRRCGVDQVGKAPS